MTEEERERRRKFIQESRAANLEGLAALARSVPEPEPDLSGSSEPVRWGARRDDPPPERERGLDTVPTALIDQRIADALKRERERNAQVMGETLRQQRQFLRRVLAEVVAHERQAAAGELRDQTRQLLVEVENLKDTISELRAVSASGDAKVIDLPRLPRRDVH